MINKIDYIKIEITEQMKVKAEEMAKKRKIATSEHSHPKDEYYGAVAELCIRKLLWEYKREYEAIEVYGKSDGGVDLIIDAGTVDVKGSGIAPGDYMHLYSTPGETDKADFFAQCFIVDEEMVGYFVGMETRDNLIKDSNLQEVVSERYKLNLKAYGVYVRDLTIKPALILTDSFTKLKEGEKAVEVNIIKTPEIKKKGRSVAEMQKRLLAIGKEIGKKRTASTPTLLL